MIRPMTSEEIKRALRHAAEVCIERNISAWAGQSVTPQDGAFLAAYDFINDGEEDDADTPEHAATFLLIVAEAL